VPPRARHIVMAIPNHPWTKATKGAAAVRIAMTVVQRGTLPGAVHQTTTEEGLTTDEPKISFRETYGRINSNLTIGPDVTQTISLHTGEGICHDGVKLHGKGFIVDRAMADPIGLGRRHGADTVIRPFVSGRDANQQLRRRLVIDLFGLDVDGVRVRFQEIYQHLLGTVKTVRDAQFARSATKDAEAYAREWWLFGKPRQELRPAL
jgi:hypothetical protein